MAKEDSSNGAKQGLADELRDGRAFLPIWDGSSIDKREFLRLTLQSLRELGFESSAKALEAESGLTLEHPSITAFRNAVLSGDWKNTERLLLDGLTYASRKARGRLDSSSGGESSTVSLDVVLRQPEVIGLDSIKFMLQRQRYLELLEARQTKKALSVLRDRLMPLSRGTDQLHLLSSLVMCASPDELHLRADWDGASGDSRRQLLMDIEAAVSPGVMVPSRRLASLLEQAQSWQKQQDPFFNLAPGAHLSLLVDHESDHSVFPSTVSQVLRGHLDEVWHLEFSRDGTKLASAGKDKYVIVWSITLEECKMIEKLGPHADPVSCVTWSHDDKRLLATSESDVTIWSTDTWTQTTHAEHVYTVGTAAWNLKTEGFATGGMDGKIVFWDRYANVEEICVTSPFRVLALALSPDGRHLVAVSNRHVGTAARLSSEYGDSPIPSPEQLGGGSRTMSDERYRLHFYDVSTRTEVGSVYISEEMSSVSISRDSRYALISKRPNEVQLWDIEEQILVQKYTGHKVDQHVIRCGLGGFEDNFVVSGSEDANVYVWHRPSGKLIETLRGHEIGSVNAVSWNPKDHSMIASCGDDQTIRIWRPGKLPSRSSRREEKKQPSEDDGGNPFPWAADDMDEAM